jgi:hypothetical protein
MLFLLNINVFYVSIRYYDIIHFNFRLTFDLKLNSSENFKEIFFDQIPSISILIDVLLKFNAAIYKKGNLIEDRLQIATNYLESDFIFDIFVVIPYFISLQLNLPYFDLVILLKVFQISKLGKSLFDRLELNKT